MKPGDPNETLSEVLEQGFDVAAIHCPSCRVIVELSLKRVHVAVWTPWPMVRAKFKCRRCGRRPESEDITLEIDAERTVINPQERRTRQG